MAIFLCELGDNIPALFLDDPHKCVASFLDEFVASFLCELGYNIPTILLVDPCEFVASFLCELGDNNLHFCCEKPLHVEEYRVIFAPLLSLHLAVRNPHEIRHLSLCFFLKKGDYVP